MLPVLTPDEMGAADARTIAAGTPVEVLMERAGRAVAWVVRTRAQDPSSYVEPPPRADDELLGALSARNAELETALRAADPHEPVWTWAPQKDVAFVLRRQAHEAVIHVVDVEQVIGDVRPIPPDVALDGLDEWLEVVVPRLLPQGPPEDAHPVVFHAVDADAERTLFPGSRPFPIAALTGTAGDLLMAAWHRIPLDVVTVDGDGLQAAAILGLRPDVAAPYPHREGGREVFQFA